jgi:hypothetical protein
VAKQRRYAWPSVAPVRVILPPKRASSVKTIWLFRERLTRAGAIEALLERFDQVERAASYIAMAGQIVDASLVAAPKQRNQPAGVLRHSCPPSR